ncbi:MAG: hypothetical protein CL610_25465 [Anaerolineaceae bacterium]|nr:hypothetical protein [Anaerolineaceae bacterium]
MADSNNKWYGDELYFGLHYDLHANANDTDLGTRADPETLIPLLKLMKPQWVQTDCKGHPGMTSWFSEVPDATVSPGTVNDAMAGWRAATRELGIPLHCHYSGISDTAASMKHPEWCVVEKDGTILDGNVAESSFPPRNGIMSPFGPYADKLLIPQMLELVDRYGVDGFWVDGEIWAVNADYSDTAKKAFAEQTGITEIPDKVGDPNWNTWMQFQRDAFHNYVTHYCDVVHDHNSNVRICSNWLQTFRHPGEPNVPTDWISGDNVWVWGMDGSRCETRFISTRGKHWDIMLWGFYKIGPLHNWRMPWVFKPVQMLQQEASVTLAMGGSVQIYEHGGKLRDGDLVPWRMSRMGEVGEFVQKRRELCQNTETIPQVAVLHSEHHYYTDFERPFPLPRERGTPVQAATFALLENHFGVDILDEWALLPRINDFKLIVVPERFNMSEDMVQALKQYVEQGGSLLLTGAEVYDRFGADFIGAESITVEEDVDYHVPARSGAAPIYSKTWRMLKPTSAISNGRVLKTARLDTHLTEYAAATINQYGEGTVAYIPCDVFGFFYDTRYPLISEFIGELAQQITGKLPIRYSGPTGVDMVLRQKDDRTLVHLINLTSGLPNSPSAGAIDEIPQIGPITVEIDRATPPTSVGLAFEDGAFKWTYQHGTIIATLDRLHIHAAIVVE